MVNKEDQTTKEDEVLTIPKGYFVYNVDMDCEEPHCVVCPDERLSAYDEIKIFIPRSLAYYLTHHFCGSRRMDASAEERGERKVQNKIKEALGIEG